MNGMLPAPVRAMPWSMLVVVLAITGMGLVTLYSAAGGSASPWASNQAIRFSVLFVGMLVLSRVPVSLWKRHAYTFYVITLGLLLVVELFGKIGMGAQRWIDLGVIRLQPSEFMKLASVMALAKFYDRVPGGFISQPQVLVIPVAIVAAPAALVMLQPDLGTAMMISLAGTAVIFLAGTKLRWFLGAGAIIGALLPVAWGLLHDYQKNRVLIFMNPESDPLGTGYHLSQSKIAIGSGGPFGKGFLNGTQSHLQYLPETHTDFIFATMTEEWGLAGGIVVLLAYGYLIKWAMGRGFEAPSMFARLTATGLAFTLFLYVSINMAMVMGLAPVVGIPLPLLSYGGSAMMTVLILLGILMSIHRQENAASRLLA